MTHCYSLSAYLCQVLLGVMVMSVASFAQVHCYPFSTRLMNIFEVISTNLSLMTFFLGVFTMEKGYMEHMELPPDTASVAVLVLNICWLVLLAPIGCYLALDSKKRSKIRHILLELQGKKLTDYTQPKGSQIQSESIELVTAINDNTETKTSVVSCEDIGVLLQPKVDMTSHTDEPEPLITQVVHVEACLDAHKSTKSDAAIVADQTDMANNLITSPELPCVIIEDKSTEIESTVSANELEQRKENDNVVGLLEAPPKNQSVSISTDLQDTPVEALVGDIKIKTTLASDVRTTDKVKVLLVAKGPRQAKDSSQLSFCKGDLVEVVDSSGLWHFGILHKSTSYPITGEVKKYPPSFFKTYVTRAAQHEVPTSPVGSMVIARGDHVAKRSGHLSFSKHDVIEVIRGSGDWHVGILRKSSSYPINGQALKYPPRLCRPQRLSDRRKEAALKASPKKTPDTGGTLKPGTMVAAVLTRETKSPGQMSFQTGDLIEVVKAYPGTQWYSGKLHRSSKYPITGQNLKFRVKFVKPVDSE